jgi:ankyrin repeat protein
MLEDTSVSPEGRDAFGWTALHKFASWNASTLCERLCEAKSVTREHVNAQGGPDGFTPVHAALDMGAFQAVATLLKHPKVDTAAVDAKERSAVQFAAALGIDLTTLCTGS